MKGSRHTNDLDTFNYLNELKKKGIWLYIDGEKLKYKAIKNILDSGVLNEIKSNKERIIKFLNLEKENSVSLSQLQLAYMAGQIEDQRLNNVNAHYYIEFLRDSIDIKRLEESLNILIQRNDVLRLIIKSKGEGLILNTVPRYKIKTYEVTKYIDKLNIRESMMHRLYPYDSWPMFHLEVGKSKVHEDVLHFSFDCSILDAWCAGKLVSDLFSIYVGQKVAYPRYSYKQYVNELCNLRNKSVETIKNADRYWTDRIVNISDGPKLEYKLELKNLESTTFVRQEYTFDTVIVGKLEKFSKENHVTLTAVIMTVYLETLSKVSSEKNLTINITMFGKLPLDKHADETLGEFTNVGLIEYKDESINFIDTVIKTQYQIFKLLEFREYEGINILNKAKRLNLFFPAVMTCMIGENYKSTLNGFREIYSLSQTPQVTIDHHVRIIDGEMRISFDYIEELFNQKYINNIIEIYVNRVNDICNSKNKGEFI